MAREGSEDSIAQCFPWITTNEGIFQRDLCSFDTSGKRLEQSQGRRISLQSWGQQLVAGLSAVVHQSVLETTGTRTLAGNTSSRTTEVLRRCL